MRISYEISYLIRKPSGKFDRVFWILDVETNEMDDFDFCKN